MAAWVAAWVAASRCPGRSTDASTKPACSASEMSHRRAEADILGGKHSSPATSVPATAGCAPGVTAHMGGGEPCGGHEAATTAATAGRACRAATGCGMDLAGGAMPD
eukprot:scaffold4188_cov73-Phaeocystis_antarctica.AAC.1